MKKFLLGAMLALSALSVSAQTFTVNALQIGSSTLAGPVYPTAATNAILKTFPSTLAPIVTRLGFTTQGDAPPLNYAATSSPCSLNSGAGDNGSQVPTADGFCWIAQFPEGRINVLEFGADKTGTNDITTAAQNAANLGKVVYYPAGTYKLAGLLTLTAGGIVGDGQEQTIINSTDTTTGNVITYSSNSAGSNPTGALFEKFFLQGTLTKTSGAGIVITAPTGENQGSKFTKISVTNFPTEISFVAASHWSVEDSLFVNYSNAGISVNNTNNADSGDSQIIGNEFVTSVSSGNKLGILQLSSGGLRIIGNKINGGNYGYFMGLTATANTSILLLSGNSIENQATAAIELSRSSGSATYSLISIVNNELGINPNGISTDGSGAFSNVTVTGNVIGLTSGTGSGISLSAVTQFYVGGNTIGANGGTPTGIGVPATSSNGKIGKNSFSGFPANGNIANSSSTTFIDRDTQYITGSVATSSAYGPLWSGSTTVTLPVAYNTAAQAVCQPTGGNAVGAGFTAGTTTSITVFALGATNGGTANFACRVESTY